MAMAKYCPKSQFGGNFVSNFVNIYFFPHYYNLAGPGPKQIAIFSPMKLFKYFVCNSSYFLKEFPFFKDQMM